MFLFLREIEKASLLIIIRGVKFLKVFQIDVRFIKHALFFLDFSFLFNEYEFLFVKIPFYK